MLPNKEVTKCPCKNCLLLPICNGRSAVPAINVISSIDKCSLLKDFLNVTAVAKTYTHFDSDLSREEIKDKINQLNTYIPCGNLHLLT